MRRFCREIEHPRLRALVPTLNRALALRESRGADFELKPYHSTALPQNAAEKHAFVQSTSLSPARELFLRLRQSS